MTRSDIKGRETNGCCGYYKLFISWAEGQMITAKKLQGDCTFVNRDAELMEINCATKLTIIIEEL